MAKTEKEHRKGVLAYVQARTEI